MGKYLSGCPVAEGHQEDLFKNFQSAREIEMLGQENPEIHQRYLQRVPIRITTTGEYWDEVRDRIASCCDSTRGQAVQWSQIFGPKATRASRMAVVACIAVTKYGCVLKGGFIRDWVVGGRE